MQVNQEHPNEPGLCLTNYNVAVARIGAGVILVPLLWGLGGLLILGNDGIPAVGCVLLLLSIPFFWIAVRTPIWIQLGEKISIRYMLHVKCYSRQEIQTIEVRDVRPILGGEARLYYPYKFILVRFTDGRKVEVKGSTQDASRLREAVAKS